MRQSLAVILVGAALGIAGALALTKIISGFLYGITATDAPTFLAVLLVFAGVAIVSIYIPARRAAMMTSEVVLRFL